MRQGGQGGGGGAPDEQEGLLGPLLGGYIVTGIEGFSLRLR